MPTPTLAFIDDAAVLRLIVQQLESAVANSTSGDTITVLHFGENLPDGFTLVAAVAELDIEPTGRVVTDAQPDMAKGTLAIECVADPEKMKQTIYKLPEIASRVAKAFDGQRLAESESNPHEVQFGRVKRQYTGAPPETSRNFKVCRVVGEFTVKRTTGNAVASR